MISYPNTHYVHTFYSLDLLMANRKYFCNSSNCKQHATLLFDAFTSMWRYCGVYYTCIPLLLKITVGFVVKVELIAFAANLANVRNFTCFALDWERTAKTNALSNGNQDLSL